MGFLKLECATFDYLKDKDFGWNIFDMPMIYNFLIVVQHYII